MNRRFRLATVLRLRERDERAAADALRVANHTLAAAIGRVELMAARLERPAPAAGTARRPLRTDADDLLGAAHHHARLRDELATARGEVTRLEAEVDDVRHRWLAARSALRAVESLRERHLATVRAHDLRAEQRSADEFAAQRARNRAGSLTRTGSALVDTGGAA